MEIVLRPGTIEIRFAPRSESWWKRWIGAWRAEREARELAQLDERVLNDIGLGASAGHPLVARIHNYRQQELRRITMARIGLI